MYNCSVCSGAVFGAAPLRPLVRGGAKRESLGTEEDDLLKKGAAAHRVINGLPGSAAVHVLAAGSEVSA